MKILLAILFSAISLQATTYYVSPTGNDTGSGIIGDPFATVNKARTSCRSLLAGDPRNIVIRGGSYTNVNVLFGSSDTNLTIDAYPGETATLIGGILLTNWVRSGSLWYATLPTFPSPPDSISSIVNKWEVRNLLVNGSTRSVSRYPASGYLTYTNIFTNTWNASNSTWTPAATADEYIKLYYQAGAVPSTLVLTNAEVFVRHQWNASQVYVESNDTNSKCLTLSPGTVMPIGAFGSSTYCFYNIAEGMVSPGLFYHDRVNGRVYYYPYTSENMNTAIVYVPTTTKIFSLSGVTNVNIKNIQLNLTTRSLSLVDAAFREGLITGSFCTNMVMDGISVKNAGNLGIVFRYGGTSSGISFINSRIENTGADGINVYGTSGSLISNNIVNKVGTLNIGHVGINGGPQTTIIRNTVYDCTYDAISITTGSKALNNYLYDFLKTVDDGGGIYSSGSVGNIIANNYVTSNITNSTRLSGIYLDVNSNNTTVTNNIISGLYLPIHNHLATNNTYMHNVFVSPGSITIRQDEVSGTLIASNIFSCASTFTLPSSSITYVTNTFYSASGTTTSIPSGSILTDPQYRKPMILDSRAGASTPSFLNGSYGVNLSLGEYGNYKQNPKIASWKFR